MVRSVMNSRTPVVDFATSCGHNKGHWLDSSRVPQCTPSPAHPVFWRAQVNLDLFHNPRELRGVSLRGGDDPIHRIASFAASSANEMWLFYFLLAVGLGEPPCQVLRPRRFSTGANGAVIFSYKANRCSTLPLSSANGLARYARSTARSNAWCAASSSAGMESGS